MSCTALESVHLIGKKWAIPVLEEIAHEQFTGFNAVVKNSGLTATTLSRMLTDLERADLIRDTSDDGRTQYALTEKGRELHDLIQEIKRWNVKWGETPEFCLNRSCLECPRLTDDSDT